ncbi:hypothetical protein WJX77_003265 [Trebouxia sp. C0004]
MYTTHKPEQQLLGCESGSGSSQALSRLMTPASWLAALDLQALTGSLVGYSATVHMDISVTKTNLMVVSYPLLAENACAAPQLKSLPPAAFAFRRVTGMSLHYGGELWGMHNPCGAAKRAQTA